MLISVPPAEDDEARRIRDIERAAQEQAAARSAEATTIGAGGLVVKDGGSIRVEAPGTIDLPGGAFSANSLTAATNVTAGGTVQGGGLVSTGNASVAGTASVGTLSASGDVTASGKLTAGGEVRLPNVPITILTSAYFATYASTNDGGRVGHVPSSRRFKQDEAPAMLDPAQLLALQLVTFRYIAAVEELGDDADHEIGLIAEDVHDLGMTWLVYYDADGLPYGIRYERLALALLPMVQSLCADVAAIKATLSTIGS